MKCGHVGLEKPSMFKTFGIWSRVVCENAAFWTQMRDAEKKDLLVWERDYQLFHSVDIFVNTAGGISFLDKSRNWTTPWNVSTK